MHLQRNATQRNATQRNATQRNAYQNYILNNNFKFYIFQFFRTLKNLSGFIRFAKNQFAIISHCHYEGNARSNLFSVDCFVSLAMTKFFNGHYEDEVRDKVGQLPSNPNLVKFDFYNLISLINKFYTKWIASGYAFAMTMKNKFAILNNNVALAHCVIQGVKTPCCSGYAFSCALKNQFEIISRNENYAFDYNKYFCRNGNNQSLSFAEGVLWERGFAKNQRQSRTASSNLFSGLLHSPTAGFSLVRNDGDGLFSRNDYGRKFIFGFGDNLNFGFLFNRKTKKINLCQRFSVGEGEQK